MNAVLMRDRGDGIVEVVDGPPVAFFSASLVDDPGPLFRSVSRENEIIRCGDLLGRQFWYRITDYLSAGFHSDTYIAELISVLGPVGC